MQQSIFVDVRNACDAVRTSLAYPASRFRRTHDHLFIRMHAGPVICMQVVASALHESVMFLLASCCINPADVKTSYSPCVRVLSVPMNVSFLNE